MLEEVSTEKELLAPKQGDVFDLTIIGAGPAGLSAALCAARARLKVLLLDKALPGGQASTAYKVTNYLGFPSGILGEDLARSMEDSIRDYDIYYRCEAVEDILNIRDSTKVIKTDLEITYETKSIIFSVGLEPKILGTDFEKQFLGRGFSYYAQGDVDSYQGKDVAVIGGGNCACYAADYLADFVEKLYLVHRSDHLKAVKSLKEKVMNNTKIDILWNTEPIDAFGIDKLEKVKLNNLITHQTTWIDVKGVFVYVGRIPPTNIISLDVDIDENGFIITDDYMKTNIPGVYAAGDIRSKQIRQIATAVSDGMVAAVNVEKDLFR